MLHPQEIPSLQRFPIEILASSLHTAPEKKKGCCLFSCLSTVPILGFLWYAGILFCAVYLRTVVYDLLAAITQAGLNVNKMTNYMEQAAFLTFVVDTALLIVMIFSGKTSQIVIAFFLFKCTFVFFLSFCERTKSNTLSTVPDIPTLCYIYGMHNH